ncbi:MAG: ribosome biogenesis GTPase Der [Acidobacteria bacterium]|nr:MAG: ribosome biogenesis GTPase Der [Acidobacteriota bacterium]
MFGHCPLIIDVTAGAAGKNQACLLCGSAGEAHSTEAAGLNESVSRFHLQRAKREIRNNIVAKILQDQHEGLLAIVGRPNVGKSTLFNKMVGRRRAIVGDEPGITRDRLYGKVRWNGRQFRVVDTGGIVPEDKDLIPSEIFRQARVALEEASAIVMVTDVRTELTGPDMELARLLQKLGKPLYLAVNKVDDPKLEAEAENFRRLGIRNLWAISAEHSTGVAELIEELMTVIPTIPETEDEKRPNNFARRILPTKESELGMDDLGYKDGPEDEDEGETPDELALEDRLLESMPSEIKIAIIGRPNVGKSTLLNQLTESERAIVSSIAGTTRDAIDEVVQHAGKQYRFIDTAGIRRKGKTHLMAEKLSVVMARKHLEEADVALMVIDAVEGVSALDANIAGYAHESGRSVVVVVNKWDLVTTARTDGKPPADSRLYEEQLRRTLKFLDYAPVIFVSAMSGKNIRRVFEAVERVACARWRRITTGEMNRFLKTVDFERASVPERNKVKIYYMTQAAVSPPTFILFTDKDVKLHFSYQRFLENEIRDAFVFEGTPIWIKISPRKRREFVPAPKKITSSREAKKLKKRD